MQLTTPYKTPHLRFLCQSTCIALPAFTSTKTHGGEVIDPNSVESWNCRVVWILQSSCVGKGYILLSSQYKWGPGCSDTEQHWTALASTFRSGESWRGQQPWTPISCIQHFVPPDTSVLHLLPKNSVLSCPQEINLFWVTKDWNCAVPADWDEGWGRKFLLQETYQPKGSDLPALDSWNLTVHLHFGREKKSVTFYIFPNWDMLQHTAWNSTSGLGFLSPNRKC